MFHLQKPTTNTEGNFRYYLQVWKKASIFSYWIVTENKHLRQPELKTGFFFQHWGRSQPRIWAILLAFIGYLAILAIYISPCSPSCLLLVSYSGFFLTFFKIDCKDWGCTHFVSQMAMPAVNGLRYGYFGGLADVVSIIFLVM